VKTTTRPPPALGSAHRARTSPASAREGAPSARASSLGAGRASELCAPSGCSTATVPAFATTTVSSCPSAAPALAQARCTGVRCAPEPRREPALSTMHRWCCRARRGGVGGRGGSHPGGKPHVTQPQSGVACAQFHAPFGEADTDAVELVLSHDLRALRQLRLGSGSAAGGDTRRVRSRRRTTRVPFGPPPSASARIDDTPLSGGAAPRTGAAASCSRPPARRQRQHLSPSPAAAKSQAPSPATHIHTGRASLRFRRGC